MTASIIDGKAYAAGLRARVAQAVAALKTETGVTPGLAVVLVGDDPASQVYVRSKTRQIQEAGMAGFDSAVTHSPRQEPAGRPRGPTRAAGFRMTEF